MDELAVMAKRLANRQFDLYWAGKREGNAEDVIAELAADIAEVLHVIDHSDLKSLIERDGQWRVVPAHDEPDWFYCAVDTDDCGDSAYEAMFYNQPRLEPVELGSSYHGPQMWGVMSPPLPDAGDDSETAHTFDTREEAEAFCKERTAMLAASPQPKDKP